MHELLVKKCGYVNWPSPMTIAVDWDVIRNKTNKQNIAHVYQTHASNLLTKSSVKSTETVGPGAQTRVRKGDIRASTRENLSLGFATR